MKKSNALQTRIVSVTLSTPKGILEMIEEEGRNGWELCAIGSNFAFLQRERGAEIPRWEYKVESITLSTPKGIQEKLNRMGAKGWAVAGLGPNFAFLKRELGGIEYRREYDLDSVTLKGIGGIRKLIDQRAAEGWGLVALEKSFAIFERLLERGTGTQLWEHKGLETKVESVTLKTPGAIQDAVESAAAEGWLVCAVTASYVFFRRLLPGAPATKPIAQTRSLGGRHVRPKLPAGVLAPRGRKPVDISRAAKGDLSRPSRLEIEDIQPARRHRRWVK